jgi:hypothetical protein
VFTSVSTPALAEASATFTVPRIVGPHDFGQIGLPGIRSVRREMKHPVRFDVANHVFDALAVSKIRGVHPDVVTDLVDPPHRMVRAE